MSTRRIAGLTLTDLLAVMFLVVFVTAITISAQAQLNDREVKILCMKNLSQWGKGLLLYSNENKGSYPRTIYENSGKVTAFTQPGKGPTGDADPYGKNNAKPAPNDITAAVFRMLITQDMTADKFVCPATEDEIDDLGDAPYQSRMNFASPYHMSYSFVNVYPTTDAIGKGYKTFITAFGSDFAVASDLNPGWEGLTKLTPASPAAEIQKGNSPNHGGSGQNVLYADAHVEFMTTPFAGANRTPRVRDNIFTYGETTDQSGGVGISGSPVDAQDSVLLPTAAERPAKRPPTSRPARAAAVGAINEAVKAAQARPLDGRSLQTLVGRKYVAANGDYLLFAAGLGEVDVRIGQQTYAGRYTPSTSARLRLVLTIKGDSVVQYFQASLADASGRVDEVTDEKGNTYKATAPPAMMPTTMPMR
jgi:prepilin-type processing-associated H-X9-DG protein